MSKDWLWQTEITQLRSIGICYHGNALYENNSAELITSAYVPRSTISIIMKFAMQKG